MRRTDGPREAIVAGALAIALVVTFSATNAGNLAFGLREGVFDRMLALFPRGGEDRRVIAVDIDETSLERRGAWPWTRKRLAALIDRIAQKHPRVIALDILLDGADRNGSRAVVARIARDEARADLAAVAESFESDDAVLAKAADAGVPVVFALGIGARRESAKFPTLVLATSGEGEVDFAPLRLPGVAGPPQDIADVAAGLGVIALDTDRDGLLRRFPLVFEERVGKAARLYPGFALDVVRAAEAAGSIILETRNRIFEAGDVKLPAPRDSLMRFYPRPPDYWRKRTISAGAVLDGDVSAIDDRSIVVIGSSAPQAGAYLPGAVMGAVSSLRAQVEAIDLLLSRSELTRPPRARWVEAGAAVAAGALAVGAAVLLPPLGASAAIAGLVATSAAASLLLFLKFRLLIDSTPTIGAALFAGALASVSIYSRVRANRALVEARFARYLAPAVVDMLARDPTRLRIAAERREVTALFTDLEGFTSFTERTPADKLITALDDYFALISSVVVAHGGMVDKIVGDAVHVFFNMPLDQPDHADRAVNCARAIMEATQDYRAQPRQVELGFGRTRVGVDSGWATVGDVGGRDKLDYTAHGEAVNRAARLQSMARDTSSGVLIGEGAVSRLASRAGLISAGKMTPRGFTQAQDVFTFG